MSSTTEPPDDRPQASPDDAGRAHVDPAPQHGISRETWRSPAGVSAIAAVIGSLVAVMALLVSSRGDDDDDPSADQSARDSPSAPVASDTGREDPPMEPADSLEGVVTSVRAAAEASLAASEEVGPSTTRGDAVVSADLPTQWDDWEVSPWLAPDSDEKIGLVLLAAPDISRFYGYEDPGFFVGVSSLPDFDAEDELERVERGWEDDCVRVGENRISGAKWTGHYEVYRDCDPVGSMIVDLGAEGPVGLYLHARLTDVGQVEYLERLLSSLTVDPPIPAGGDDTGGDQITP
jgi:hypothetical protein